MKRQNWQNTAQSKKCKQSDGVTANGKRLKFDQTTKKAKEESKVDQSGQ